MPPTVKPTPTPYVSPARENIIRLNPNKVIPVRPKFVHTVAPQIPPQPQILFNNPIPVITPTNIYKPLTTPPTPVISPVVSGPVDIPTTTTTNQSILQKYPQIVVLVPFGILLIMIKK